MPRKLDSQGYDLYLRGMNHASIINKWPSLSVFADDLGVQYGTAKAMRRRGSIPPEHWLMAIEKATERGIEEVTLEALASAVARQSSASSLLDGTEAIEAAE